MATRRGRSSVALWAAIVVTIALVGLDLLLRRFGPAGTESVVHVLCDLVPRYTPWELTGWPCYLLPGALVLVIGLLIDAVAGNRR
jgi:hypothetical protein